MSVDPVVAALRAALEAEDRSELRVALAKRLLELRQPDQALAELERVLAVKPADVETLALAGRAGRGGGGRRGGLPPRPGTGRGRRRMRWRRRRTRPTGRRTHPPPRSHVPGSGWSRTTP